MDDATTKPLLVLRILWAALLAGLLFFGVMVAVGIMNQAGEPAADTVELANLLLVLGVGLLVVLMPMGYFIRMQCYKRYWRGEVVAPEGYFKGNLVLLAICEGLALFGLVGCLMHGSFWPNVLTTLGALMVHMINFPTGRAMRPT